MVAMKHPSFWDTLQQPIIGLAPMDGVTDAPNRTMHGLYGRPDIVITEFTNVEGLWRGGDRIFRDFLYTPAERPVVSQIPQRRLFAPHSKACATGPMARPWKSWAWTRSVSNAFAR